MVKRFNLPLNGNDSVSGFTVSPDGIRVSYSVALGGDWSNERLFTHIFSNGNVITSDGEPAEDGMRVASFDFSPDCKRKCVVLSSDKQKRGTEY